MPISLRANDLEVVLRFLLSVFLFASGALVGAEERKCARVLVEQAASLRGASVSSGQQGSIQIRFFNRKTGRSVLVRETHENCLNEARQIWLAQTEGPRMNAAAAATSLMAYPLAYCTVGACIAAAYHHAFKLLGLVDGLVWDSPEAFSASAIVLFFTAPMWILPQAVVPKWQESQMTARVLEFADLVTREERNWPWDGNETLFILSRTSPETYEALAARLRERGYDLVSIPW